jgi:hypothetical protein
MLAHKVLRVLLVLKVTQEHKVMLAHKVAQALKVLRVL